MPLCLQDALREVERHVVQQLRGLADQLRGHRLAEQARLAAQVSCWAGVQRGSTHVAPVIQPKTSNRSKFSQLLWLAMRAEDGGTRQQQRYAAVAERRGASWGPRPEPSA
eukprot:scaffold42428_cov49-Phaeocystis_antarctica.AAC.1